LNALATEVPWQTSRDTTLSLTRSMYAHLPDGSPVWDGPRRVSALQRAQVLEMLAAL
jgi:hypothetical protein